MAENIWFVTQTDAAWQVNGGKRGERNLSHNYPLDMPWSRIRQDILAMYPNTAYFVHYGTPILPRVREVLS